jgi:hypothetical protein
MSKSFRDHCRTWFRDRITEEGKADLETDVQRFTDLVRGDPSLLNAFLADQLAPTVRRIGEQVINSTHVVNAPTRSPARPERTLPGRPAPIPSEPLVRTGTAVQSAQSLREEVQRETAHIQHTWGIRTPETIRIDVSRILTMSKRDVGIYANQFADHALKSAAIARWLHRIASSMDIDDRVSDVFTEQGLNQMYEEALAEQTKRSLPQQGS